MGRIAQGMLLVVLVLGLVTLDAWGPIQQQLARAESDEVPAANPFTGDAAAIRSGRSSFRSFCSPCHGGAADGRGERVVGRAADLRVFKKGFRKYVEIVKKGKKVPNRPQNMPAWGKLLPADEIYKIAAYLETLAKEGANWGEPDKK